MTEQWRAAPGFEDDYEVSDDGRVRRLRASHKNPAGFIISARPGRRGHMAVTIYRDGAPRTVYVHRLVGLAFVDGDRSLDVLHRDGNPSNNRATNLYWGNDSQNQLDAVAHGTHHLARKTHCPQGHPYSGANLYEYRGERMCRTCRAQADRASKARKRGEHS